MEGGKEEDVMEGKRKSKKGESARRDGGREGREEDIRVNKKILGSLYHFSLLTMARIVFRF